jgi:hypothetical protein
MLTLPIHELRARISGPVLTPADDGFAAEISGLDPSVVSRAARHHGRRHDRR